VKIVILSFSVFFLNLTAQANAEDIMYWFGPWECGARIAQGGSVARDVHMLPSRGETRFLLDGEVYRMDGLLDKRGAYRIRQHSGPLTGIEGRWETVRYDQLSLLEIFVTTRVYRMREIRRRMLNLMDSDLEHSVTIWEQEEDYHLARNIFYAFPVLPQSDFGLALQRISALRESRQRKAPVVDFFSDLETYQTTIERVRSNWNREVVKGQRDGAALTESAAYFGIFRDVVEAAYRHNSAAPAELVRRAREWARRFEVNSPGLEARVMRWVALLVKI
jgi:hypothetical protein